jgi:hypothetical protein
LLRGLNRAATAGPDQGTYNDRGNVDPFHKQFISRRCLSVTAELCLNHGLTAARSCREATQRCASAAGRQLHRAASCR